MGKNKEIVNALPKGMFLRGRTYEYEIKEALGQGSFGITYLAETTVQLHGELGVINTKMNVAVKEFFMREINGRDDSAVTSGSKGGLYDKYKQKFIKEAQNLSRLKNPRIVQVLESFEANNTVYYAMEFVEGGNLDDYIARKGSLSEEEAIGLSRQIAEAVAFMHSQHMLHLDLKPSNVMLRGGRVVLIDFGLSKQFDENGNPESSTTIGGGTPGYAPLEQAGYHGDLENGFPVTMDVYALGGTMYKMLTGHRPPEASEILNEGFPRVELEGRLVSEAAIRLVERAMSPVRKKRPQSMQEFVSLLEELGQGAAEEERTVVAGAGEAAGTDATEILSARQTPDETNAFIEQPPRMQEQLPSCEPEPEEENENYEERRSRKKWLWGVVCFAVVAIVAYFGHSRGMFDFGGHSVDADTTLTVIATKLKFTNSLGQTFVYSGEFTDSAGVKVPDGKGVGQYENGIYRGEYRMGIRSGKGVYNTSDKENHYIGTFKDDMYDEGTLRLRNGMYFKGTFRDGNPYDGKWYNKNNRVYSTVKNGR